MGNPWKIHGKSMDNKNGKKEMFPWYSMGPRGGPWGPMGPHEESWVPMGPHGFPWVPMGSHGFPWVPMGSHGSPPTDSISICNRFATDSTFEVPISIFRFDGNCHCSRPPHPPHIFCRPPASMENPWKIEWENHGKLNGKSMENPWEIHGS